jgi:hypothetical protein
MTDVVVAAQAAPAVPHGVMAVEMAPDEHAQPRAGAPPRLLGEWQGHSLSGDDVVPAHDAFGLEAEDLIEIDAAEGNKGGGGIGRGPAEFRVEGGQKVLAQIAVGGGDGRNARHAQLVDEPALQRLIGALAAPARLGGIAQDVLDAEPGEGPAP